jgi:hypothetical protein
MAEHSESIAEKDCMLPTETLPNRDRAFATPLISLNRLPPTRSENRWSRTLLNPEKRLRSCGLKHDGTVILANQNVMSENTTEIYRAFEFLGADARLLATIGSWGDTLDDSQVLKLLKQ